jgi:glycosyltransferase involved in cell wall biosynthesis
MHILQLISSGGFFGAENVVLELAGQLIRCGVDVTVGVLRNSYNPHLELVEACKRRGLEVDVIPCEGRFDWSTVQRVRRVVKKRGVELIHSHGYKANFYALMSSLGLGVPLVATCHNWPARELKMQGYARLDRLLLRRFDRVAAVSGDVRDTLLRSGLAEAKIAVIANGISLARFEHLNRGDAQRRALGLAPDETIIGMIGRVSPEKGHRILLELAAGIHASFPRTRFLIVGDGPLRAELEREYRNDYVTFRDSTPDIERVYACLDLLVMPSLTEGLPLVLLEGMACGLPVIASRVGAIPTVVTHQKSGWLCDPGDSRGLRDALNVFLEAPERARVIGQQGKAVVTERYSAEAMCHAYLDHYRVVFGAKGRA